MAGCALTQSITLTCRDAIGGIKTVYILEKENLQTSGITSSASTITAISTVGNRKFFTYNMENETGNYKETPTPSDANNSLFYVQDLTIKIFKPSISIKSEIDLLAKNRLSVIVLDNNGLYWLLGESAGIKMQASVLDAGTALGDANAYSLVFKGNEPSFAKQVAPGIIAGIVA